jgi:NAD(P)-dependent dehydrogenase (short-subunit alcohol dehydrogenase family)
MTAKSPVILILGAGVNVGQAIARTFTSKGYKVALAARSLKEADSTDDQLNIPSDFSNTDSIVSAFAKVEKVFGIPSVVVYNGDPLSLIVPLLVDSTDTSQLAPGA